jgi:Zn finger protein HypA/HybF involved in hydrogenase expression
MNAKPIEIADVVNRFIEPYRRQYGQQMLPSHRRAINDIRACMTPAMGGGRYRCRNCNETFWSHHGCRNRACPKCHGRQIARWLEQRTAELLPCDYFHLVATVPAELRGLFLRNQKLLYGLLMKTVASTVSELAALKCYIGAVPAILAVLHTWTGQLHYHPHVHLLVSGGGLDKDGSIWREARYKFLVPVKKLSPMISQRFAEALQKERPDLFTQIPAKVWKKEWCSFCKPAGNGREAVLQYLSRYVFRIAITRNRILSMDESHVSFRYKHSHTGKWYTERITGVEFIRRFLLHVLPRGFHKVRYYGLWSAPNQSRHRAARIKLQLLRHESTPAPLMVSDIVEDALSSSELEIHAFVVKCPRCKSTDLQLLERRLRGGLTVT